jgi:hypothetical protein
LLPDKQPACQCSALALSDISQMLSGGSQNGPGNWADEHVDGWRGVTRAVKADPNFHDGGCRSRRARWQPRGIKGIVADYPSIAQVKMTA